MKPKNRLLFLSLAMLGLFAVAQAQDYSAVYDITKGYLGLNYSHPGRIITVDIRAILSSSSDSAEASM